MRALGVSRVSLRGIECVWEENGHSLLFEIESRAQDDGKAL